MYLKVGTTRLARGSAGVAIRQDPVLNDLREIWAHDVTLEISIFITTQRATHNQQIADITSQTNAVAQLFARNNLDIRYQHLNGTNSHIVLLNSQCLGGVRILEPPQWPDSKGAEHVTKRTMTVKVGGRVPVDSSNLKSLLSKFTEEVRFEPAGAKYGMQETLETRAVRQRLQRYQAYRATQSGTAIGLYGYPQVPRPLWPFALVNEDPLVIYGHPEVIGNDLCNFPISWTWLYASETRLSGRPNIWRRNIF